VEAKKKLKSHKKGEEGISLELHSKGGGDSSSPLSEETGRVNREKGSGVAVSVLQREEKIWYIPP